MASFSWLSLRSAKTCKFFCKKRQGDSLHDDYYFILNKQNIKESMIEPLLFGIVLGIIPVTIIGLFVAAYLQYRRGNQLEL
jgi:cytochrome b6-f complex subunit 5